MKNEILEMKDLTDSRELMIKKSPPIITVLIMLVSIVIIIALIWAYFGKLDTYAVANGEIRTIENLSTIKIPSSGKISKINYDDGEHVKKGEILFELDSEYYDEQKRIIEKQIEEKKLYLENYNKLIESIKYDKNLFNQETDSIFYNQYESYRLDLDDTLKKIASNNKQINANKNEIMQTISQNQSDLDNANKLYNDYTELYNAINGDYEYNGANKSAINTYNTYITSLEKAKSLYDSCVIAYQELLNQKAENPDSVTQEQITQAENSKNAAYADIKITKTSILNEINATLNDLENKKSSYESNINLYNSKKDALESDNSELNSKEKIKNSYYINIDNSVQKIKSELDSLESQLNEINETILQLSIVAPQDGIITYSEEITVGEIISSGSTIASIVPNSENFTVDLYIPEYCISDIEIGQKIEYSFSSISSTDYGKIYGKILSVSADSFTEQSSGKKYYKATSSIDKIQLKDKDDDIKNIKVGMIVEARMITGSQSVLSWLLDKLNFN